MAINPIQYTFSGPTPMQSGLAGLELGEQITLGRAANERAQAQEGRAQEMFPVQMQSAQLGLQAQELGLRAQEQQIAAQRQQMQRGEALKQSYADLIRKGSSATFEDYAAKAAEFPEEGAAIMEMFDQMDEMRQKPLIATLAQSATALKSGNIDVGIDVAKQYAEAARASGDVRSATMADAAIQLAELNPGAALAHIGTLLYHVAPELAETALGKPGGSGVKSSEILPDGTIIQSTDSGPAVYTAGGRLLSGKEAEDKVREAQEFGVGLQQDIYGARRRGTLKEDIELGGAAAGAERLGTETVAQAISAFEALGKTQQNIGTINTAIRAIDEGAKSGAIQKFFPNITQSSAELENAMTRMGLDVIGSVTFGALSEGEMRLAMEAAVPRNLDEGPLREWLVAKRDAQEKAAEALYNAARYLSTPGNTLNTWLEEQGGAASADPRGTNVQLDEQAQRFGLTTEEANFVVQMQNVKSQGQQLSPEQIQRLQQINQKMVRQ